MLDFLLNLLRVLYTDPLFWSGFALGFALALLFRTKGWRRVLLWTLFRGYRFEADGALHRSGSEESEREGCCPDCILLFRRSALRNGVCPFCGFRSMKPSPPPPAQRFIARKPNRR